MKAWQGYAHASVVALSVWFCRETIFEALQWWHGRPPSDGLLLGFCIVLTGLACVPIVAVHFSHVLVLIVILFSLSLFCFYPLIEFVRPKRKKKLGYKRLELLTSYSTAQVNTDIHAANEFCFS